MMRRRAFVIATIAWTSFAARARRQASPPKAALIRWPGPHDDLHGFMAIPAAARGRQPALLVLGDREDYARAVALWIAQIGFVACAPKSLAIADLIATAHWLATNSYATGRVGAILLGTGDDTLAALAPALTCAIVTSRPATEPVGLPILGINRLAPEAPADYARAEAFLKEHLG